MLQTPVVIMIYNRPKNTRQLVDALRLVEPATVYVIADGPKEKDTCEGLRRIENARREVEKIDWPCRVIREYATENMGCDARIKSGLSLVFSREEEAIVLEDDCIPGKDFFYYCQELLQRYKEDEQIGYISGTNPCPISSQRDSYAFSRRGDTWGWATWRRVWEQVPADFSDYWERAKEEQTFLQVMGKVRGESFVREVEQSVAGGVFPWDYQMLSILFAKGQWAIVPRVNLIQNIGFSTDSTHTVQAPEGYGGPALPLEFPLRHPQTRQVDEAYDRVKFARTYRNDEAIRICRKLKRGLRVAERKIKKAQGMTLGRLVGENAINQKVYPLENVGQSSHGKNCLLMYQRKPFMSTEAHFTHQNQLQSLALAQVLGELGYNVDVIDYNERKVSFRREYDLVLDMLGGANIVYKKALRQDGKRVAYLTTSNPAVSNERDRRWMEDLAKRRGVDLPPSREMALLSPEIAQYDGVLLFGNEETLKTYDDLPMPPTYLIQNSGYTDLPRKTNVDCPDARSFLYFASSGQVHKGLDRLLEVFGRTDFPYTLYVCGNFEKETAFVEAFREELYNRKNIIPVGHVDVRGETFAELTGKCAYSISPSCAEGMSGGVLTTMSEGVIPICSKYCGFGEEDVFLLEDCELPTLEQAIRFYGEQAPEWILKEREKARERVLEKYTMKDFSDSVRRGLSAILHL